MDGLESVTPPHSIDDVRRKYIQSVHIPMNKIENAEMVEQMTKVNQELTALLYLISSKGMSNNLPAISKKGNLFDFKG